METASARRRLTAFAGTFAAGCVLLAALNFLVNPLGYYPTKLVRPLTWSSRGRKTELMAQTPTHSAPAVVILGSSRSMKLSPREVQTLRGQTAFNAAVDSARAEDLYAMLGYALDGLGWRPKDLVIGVDIEAFHDHVETDPRLVSSSALRGYLPADIQWNAYEKMAGALLSYQQTAESVQALRLLARGFPEDNLRFEPDGELVYLDYERALANGTFKLDLDTSMREYDGRFAGFTALDARRTELFAAMVKRAHESGVTVHAFITPLHPALLAHLRATRDFDRLHGLALAYLEKLAQTVPGVVVRDFTELTSFGGNADDFYDGAHVMPANAARLLRAVWER